MSDPIPLETKEAKAERLRKERIKRMAKTLRESYKALKEEGFSHEDAKELSWSEDE